MIRTGLLAVISVFLATAGQLMLRAGMKRIGYVGTERLGRPMELIVQVAREPRVALGLLVFAISAVVWLIVLSRVPLSVAYPFAGLTYILTVVFGKYVLDEQVPLLRWAGLTLILVGILVVARTAPPGVE